jgi:hypothetical protein
MCRCSPSAPTSPQFSSGWLPSDTDSLQGTLQVFVSHTTLPKQIARSRDLLRFILLRDYSVYLTDCFCYLCRNLATETSVREPVRNKINLRQYFYSYSVCEQTNLRLCNRRGNLRVLCVEYLSTSLAEGIIYYWIKHR